MTITLPTSHLGQNGICYVGVRASDNEPWRYTRLNENGQVMLSNRFLRASSEKISSKYSFGLYRTNLQLALFVYNEEKEEQSESISADSFTATTTAVIAKKDGAYTEDLTVNFTITGLNLDRIKASDLTALVTYKSNSKTPVTIKANGTNCTYVSSGESDAAVDGKDYFAHSFKIGSLNSESSMSGVAKYSFTLNLNGVKLEDFKPEFLLEIGCDSNITGLIPFSYAGYIKFEAKDSSEPEPEPQPEPTPTPTPTPGVTYTLDLLKGKGIATVTGAGSYEAGTSVTASCTMQEGYEFANWTGDITTEHFIMPEENATMTANATPIEYTISYIINGGEFAEGVASPTVFTVESEGFSVPTPTKLNYNFKAWYDKNGNSIATIVPGTTGDKILTASYTPKFFNITYNLADGALEEGKTNPASYSIESSLITLNNPTRDGYIFRGWTGTGITEGTASETVTIPLGSTGNRSYVASWTEAVSILTFTLTEGVTLELRKVIQDSKLYYMGTYEVTQEQYFAIMGTNPSNFKNGLAANVNPHGQTTASCPVETVRWNDIMAENTGFMAILNASLTAQLTTKGLSGYQFTLPTQAQWVYTCNAGGSDGYCMGDNGTETGVQVTESTLSGYAVYNTSSPVSVGSKSSNLWGFYDMHGNVWEWTLTKRGSKNRVICGGSYGGNADGCRSSSDLGNDPNVGSFNVGFRVALVPPSN